MRMIEVPTNTPTEFELRIGLLIYRAGGRTERQEKGRRHRNRGWRRLGGKRRQERRKHTHKMREIKGPESACRISMQSMLKSFRL